jgi:hypothetical protein
VRDSSATFGIAPTLDPAVVKKAYFAAAHAPHRDPDGWAEVLKEG